MSVKSVVFKFRGAQIDGSINILEQNLVIKFDFFRPLIDEIKAMTGARWSPESKAWTVRNCPHNLFMLKYLLGKDPYAKYDQKPVKLETRRSLFNHQRMMSEGALAWRQVIWAAEMGTGKTLSAIEVIEHSGVVDWLWVGPKSGLRAVELEFRKWGLTCMPDLVTYDSLRKYVDKRRQEGLGPPRGVIFDESSKLKTPSTKRTQAALELTEWMRDAHHDPYIILMSGTPAPKAPSDWWSQCEVAQPGFVKEGDIHKFNRRYGLWIKRETGIGQLFPVLLTWYDDPNKCKICGKFENEHESGMSPVFEIKAHQFERSENEVHNLYNRLKGLVTVVLKKDCLDLPQRVYREVEIKPTQEVKFLAQMITKTSKNAITALTRLRELSDGFQYRKQSDLEKRVPCEACNGTGEQIEYVGSVVPVDDYSGSVEWSDELIKPQKVECSVCTGLGTVHPEVRHTREITSPKLEAMKELYEEFEEYNRLVVFAGFRGSIDMICNNLPDNWYFIRLDGRGWHTNVPGCPQNAIDMLQLFQQPVDQPSLTVQHNIVFVAHPASGGMALTLTASPAEVFYSNTFNSEHRSQAMARIERVGARGNLIIDLFHLESDRRVHQNLMAKRALETMSLGELQNAFDEV